MVSWFVISSFISKKLEPRAGGFGLIVESSRINDSIILLPGFDFVQLPASRRCLDSAKVLQANYLNLDIVSSYVNKFA